MLPKCSPCWTKCALNPTGANDRATSLWLLATAQMSWRLDRHRSINRELAVKIVMIGGMGFLG